jgi:plastocyanin
MHWMRGSRACALGAAALAAAALAACGEDDDTQTVSPGGSGAEAGAGSTGALVVKGTDFALDPKDLKITDSGRVAITFTNDGKATHALEIEGQGIERKTPNIGPGKSSQLVVTLKDGTYDMYCPVDGHKQLGMDGTVTVGDKSRQQAPTDEAGAEDSTTTRDSTTTEEDGY